MAGPTTIPLSNATSSCKRKSPGPRLTESVCRWFRPALPRPCLSPGVTWPPSGRGQYDQLEVRERSIFQRWGGESLCRLASSRRPLGCLAWRTPSRGRVLDLDWRIQVDVWQLEVWPGREGGQPLSQIQWRLECCEVLWHHVRICLSVSRFESVHLIDSF